MSTHSLIAITNRDGTYTSITCHFDGYLKWNGNLLLKHFRTIKDIEALLDNGDLNAIKQDGTPDLFDGQYWEKKVVSQTWNNFLKYARNWEFTYLWSRERRCWTVRNKYVTRGKFVPLTNKLIEKHPFLDFL